MEKSLLGEFNIKTPVADWIKQEPTLDEEKIKVRVLENATRDYEEKFAGVEHKEYVRQFERGVMLQTLDNHWREHLASLDHLRQGIHLRGYAQKNPKQEYKREAFELFSGLLDVVKREVTQKLMLVRVQTEQEVEQAAEQVEHIPEPKNVQYHHADYEEALETAQAGDDTAVQPFVRQGQKIGRNDPCPCGSGKKYKQCHGKLT